MKPPESFLPDFCSLQTPFVLVVASLLLAFGPTLADFSSVYGFWSDLGLRAFFIIWVVLLSGAVLCAVRNLLMLLDPARGGVATFRVVQDVALVVTGGVHSHSGRFGYIHPPGSDFASFGPRMNRNANARFC